MNDIMIDIETLSTQPDAAILSIGAAQFDINTGNIGATFDRGIRMHNDSNYGHIDPETVRWWLTTEISTQQNNILSTTTEGLLLEFALDEFARFINDLEETPTHYWSNGSTFDLVILRNAYKRCRLQCPWLHWHERDVRTIVDLGRRIFDFDPKNEIMFDGTPHSALDDAVHQAKYVSAIYQKLQESAHG